MMRGSGRENCVLEDPIGPHLVSGFNRFSAIWLHSRKKIAYSRPDREFGPDRPRPARQVRYIYIINLVIKKEEDFTPLPPNGHKT